MTARNIEGRSGFIAATLSPISTYVGMQTLRSGGSAADAVIATALTQIATNLGSIVSYAGVLQLEYYDAKTRKISSGVDPIQYTGMTRGRDAARSAAS